MLRVDEDELLLALLCCEVACVAPLVCSEAWALGVDVTPGERLRGEMLCRDGGRDGASPVSSELLEEVHDNGMDSMSYGNRCWPGVFGGGVVP